MVKHIRLCQQPIWLYTLNINIDKKDITEKHPLSRINKGFLIFQKLIFLYSIRWHFNLKIQNLIVWHETLILCYLIFHKIHDDFLSKISSKFFYTFFPKHTIIFATD